MDYGKVYEVWASAVSIDADELAFAKDGCTIDLEFPSRGRLWVDESCEEVYSDYEDAFWNMNHNTLMMNEIALCDFGVEISETHMHIFDLDADGFPIDYEDNYQWDYHADRTTVVDKTGRIVKICNSFEAAKEYAVGLLERAKEEA